MIPKIIHYCWFGRNPLPDIVMKCMNSWGKFLPDYEVKRWDESCFDVTQNSYVNEAYNSGKYAFVSDYVRLYALINYGGIYLDTDVEVIRNLDEFLTLDAFSGFENYESIPTGIMGAIKGFPGFVELIKYYEDRHFIKADRSYDVTTNVKIITDYYYEKGLIRNNSYQVIDGFTIFPSRCFCPAVEDRKIGLENVYTIHYKNGSWLSEEERLQRYSLSFRIKTRIKYIVKKIFGNRTYDTIMNHIRNSNKRR